MQNQQENQQTQTLAQFPDWGELWQQAQKEKNWRHKGPEHWDKKASSFAKRVSTSVYTEKFIDQLPLQADWTVLDVGSGPGTLTLPLASRCQAVTALDFSNGMLDILRQRAVAEQRENISTQQLSWEDDWQAAGVAIHDVAVASRSLAVADLPVALNKLTSFARKLVCVTDKVGAGQGPLI